MVGGCGGRAVSETLPTVWHQPDPAWGLFLGREGGSHHHGERCQQSRGTAQPPKANHRPSEARSAAAPASSPPRGGPPAPPAARWPPAPGEGTRGQSLPGGDGELPWWPPLPAHLAGGAAGVEPLLARHAALADAAEGLTQGLLEGLHAGQGPLHGQRVIGVQCTPAGTDAAQNPPCCSRGSPAPRSPHTWPARGCADSSRRVQSRGWCRRPRGSTRSGG